MDVQTYNKVFLPQWTTASLFIRNLQLTLEGKCDKESLRQLQIIGWNEETKKFISDVLNLYKEKVVNELNSCSNYEHGNIKNCPICGKQSLSASNHYCRDHTNSDDTDTDKYHIEYDGVICTKVNWKTKEFYFTFKGKEYKYKQQGNISCNADTDHIRCVIKEFKEKTKDEENTMENYIVINGKKEELTEEQLNYLCMFNRFVQMAKEQFGLTITQKETAGETFKTLFGVDFSDCSERNNPFNNELNYREYYYTISSTDDIIVRDIKSNGIDESDERSIINANSFNDKDFAKQVYLHELLNRKLLKYAWDNNAEDCEWNGENLHYYIFLDTLSNKFRVEDYFNAKTLSTIHFSNEKIAEQAIKDIIEPFMAEHPEFVW